jgi:hypothetical protein
MRPLWRVFEKEYETLKQVRASLELLQGTLQPGDAIYPKIADLVAKCSERLEALESGIACFKENTGKGKLPRSCHQLSMIRLALNMKGNVMKKGF